MPPVLDPSKSKVDGLAFLGLSLTRHSPQGHPDSLTHQTSFDLNLVQDREYKYIFSTNDDGWLVGGGEPGPPTSYKLPAKDSSHVEIMRIGTYNPSWGGVSQKEIIEVMESGRILIPQMDVVPTAVVANPDTPPELEIRFDMDPPVLPDLEACTEPLPVNWQLRFVHNQLFRYFQFPSRFCPGAFHSTILRKAEFRSHQAEKEYFTRCARVVEQWRKEGPKPLNNGGWDIHGQPLEYTNADGSHSGIYLFTDRNTITHFFKPNFLPPYDTLEKRKIIYDYLKEEWDEKSLTFQPVKSIVDTALERLKERKEMSRLKKKKEMEERKRLKEEQEEGEGGDENGGDKFNKKEQSDDDVGGLSAALSAAAFSNVKGGGKKEMREEKLTANPKTSDENIVVAGEEEVEVEQDKYSPSE